MWTAGTLLLTLFSCIIFPVQWAWADAFTSRPTLYVWLAIDVVVCLLFLLTILLNFRTGVTLRGVLDMTPAAVARYYLRSGWLLVDVLPAIPVFAFTALDSEGSNVYRWIGLVKLLRIGQFHQELSSLLSSKLHLSTHPSPLLAHPIAWARNICIRDNRWP